MKETMMVNGKEYTLLKLLGKGKGGYSWLAEADDGRAVTLKQIHHEPCDYYQFGDKLAAELADYRRLSEIGIPMPEMLDVDRENERIVKEYIKGETVYEMVLQDRLPETCLEQIRAMCRLLYPAHTNIDYFPTNFILQTWTNGTLKTGASNTGPKRRHSFSMPQSIPCEVTRWRSEACMPTSGRPRWP